MLSKVTQRLLVIKRVTALIVLFFYVNLVLGDVVAWAGAFEDMVQSGHSMGQTMTEDYKPSNLNTTLQNKGLTSTTAIVPHGDAAAAKQAEQGSYYNNPAAMTGGADTEISQTVSDIISSRAEVDLSEDNTFGYKCKERDAEGKCTIWSSSTDILNNSYKDCETVLTPVYDDDPVYKTCTGAKTAYTKQCSSRIYANVTQEVYTAPCQSLDLGVGPGQIYARCKDIYSWYKVLTGTGRYQDDCDCINHGDFGCFRASEYVLGDPPAGATLFATSYENFRDRGDDSGWDSCTEDTYGWYYAYERSVVERLSLMEDTTCPTFDTLIENECAVTSMTQCDSSGSYCFNSIKDSKATGLLPQLEERISQTTSSYPVSCEEACTSEEVDRGDGVIDTIYDCSKPEFEGCAGLCPSGSVSVSSAPGYYSKTGTEYISQDLLGSCTPVGQPVCDENGLNCTWVPNQATISTVDYYSNGFTCKNVGGQLDNYTTCLTYEQITVGDSFSTGGSLATVPVRADWSYPYQYRDRGGTLHDVYFITEASLRGGPDVRPYRNVWKMDTSLACTTNTSDCDTLVAQGCAYESTTCNNDDCTDRTLKYLCGGTGNVTAYEKAYVCAGQVRCMGTDCKEVIKVDSGQFAKAAAAGEILNMMRIDSAQGNIFPGDKFECQSAPKSCCDGSVGGISVGDYIAAGKALYEVGSASAQAYAPTFYNAAEGLVSHLPAGGQVLTQNAAGELVNQSVTEVMKQAVKEAATQALTAVLEAAGVDAAASTAAAAIGAICTVIWVLAVLYAIYVILNFLYGWLFGCDEEDMATSVKLTLQLCHLVGEKDEKALGMNLKKRSVYCCFNSVLARVIHEQGRPQISRGWGPVDNPDCGGLSIGEMNQIDFSAIDVSEYMQYVKTKTNLTEAEQAATLQKASGSVFQLRNQ